MSSEGGDDLPADGPWDAVGNSDVSVRPEMRLRLVPFGPSHGCPDWAGTSGRPWLVANRATLPQKWPPPPWNVAGPCELTEMSLGGRRRGSSRRASARRKTLSLSLFLTLCRSISLSVSLPLSLSLSLCLSVYLSLCLCFSHGHDSHGCPDCFWWQAEGFVSKGERAEQDLREWGADASPV